MGKCIYRPVGKAGEYAQWACNLYLGCSNDCDYCYCKQGVLGTVAGAKEAKLKKCFTDTDDAFATFVKEARENETELRKSGGLFFSFTSDPCLPETIDLTLMCVSFATGMGIPCQILTKCAAWMDDENVMGALRLAKQHLAIGFTLTGMDEMERGKTVSSNDQRVLALRKLHEEGFRTFASMEPVVDITKAMEVFAKSEGAVDLYKIGLLSGKKDYDKAELRQMIAFVGAVCEEHNTPVYWKKSLKHLNGGPVGGKMSVEEDFDIFSIKR